MSTPLQRPTTVLDLKDWLITLTSGILPQDLRCSSEDTLQSLLSLLSQEVCLLKKKVNETVGTLRTDNAIFVIILVVVVYIFAALTFFPALALGPIAEHLTLWM